MQLLLLKTSKKQLITSQIFPILKPTKQKILQNKSRPTTYFIDK